MTTPYWTDGKRTIYHGDCREILPTLGKFDLLLTDPPYGIKRHDKPSTESDLMHRLTKGETAWNTSLPVEFISSLPGYAEKAVVWGANNFQLPSSEYFLVWDKEQTVPNFASAELAWTNIICPAKVLRYSIHQHNKDGRMHPAQKPVLLMRWCISFAPNAKTILDPFMGSGTTLLAAKLEGLEAVGIELSEKYCEAAVKRLQQNTLDFLE